MCAKETAALPYSLLHPLFRVSFPEAIRYPGGAVVTDTNQNGLPELFIIRYSVPWDQPPGTLLPMSVYEFNLDGTATEISGEVLTEGIPMTEFGRQIILADLNGDGIDDVIIADHGYDADPFPGAMNRVYISNGEGQLVDRSNDFSRGETFTHSVAVGDIDGDGRPDILFGDLGVDSLYVATVDTDGAVLFDIFELPANNINEFSTVKMADLDGSGRDAIILGVDQNIDDEGRSVVARWTGTEFDITFLPAPSRYPSVINLDIAVRDLDGDGLQDIILLQTAARPFYQGFYMQFLTQQEDGSFIDSTTDYVDPAIFTTPNATGPWASRMLFHDVTGNGQEDIFVEMRWPGAHRLLLRGEDGRFEATEFNTPGANEILALADVTGDGQKELLLIEERYVDVIALGAQPDLLWVDVWDRNFSGLDGAEVAVTIAGETQTGVVEAGFVTFDIAPGSVGQVEAVRAYDASVDPAITARDALEVLRLAVGLPPSWGFTSAHDFIAADINRDGQVTAGDALEVLRTAVGLESAHAPQWVFVDMHTDLSGITRTAVDYDTGIAINAPSANLDVAMTGILLGNMEEYI